MKTAKEFLKDRNIYPNAKLGTSEYSDLMERYAEHYHTEKMKDIISEDQDLDKRFMPDDCVILVKPNYLHKDGSIHTACTVFDNDGITAIHFTKKENLYIQP